MSSFSSAFSVRNPYPGTVHLAVRNTVARLITINCQNDETGAQESFSFYPGNQGDLAVPARVMEGDFAKALLNSGDLVAYPVNG